MNEKFYIKQIMLQDACYARKELCHYISQLPSGFYKIDEFLAHEIACTASLLPENEAELFIASLSKQHQRVFLDMAFKLLW